MLNRSIWGIVCALGIAGISITACSADIKSAGFCDPNDPSCTTAADKTGGKTTAKDGGSSTPAPTNPATPSPAKPGTDAGHTSGGDGGAGGTEATCGDKSTFDTCLSCCVDFHKAGDQVAAQAFDDCVCGTPGTCKTECAASWCAQGGPDPKMGDACDVCLTAANKGACGMTAKTACDGNADCKAIGACVMANKCDMKM